ncbi:hypothetical protein, conserved [Eimeria tenella]|uniref:CCHC-type domain-containing protein n=1 Tax=Eimeria tenella TaxID=5802 RepID=U6KU32_EIMTE|nr:hypothetical protein, conserved [Eimeria tenella]CDJ41446.1 hypothetical protein, conserved [Eimeria tenella]|eukprot:XP_013232196.1 hypothetical protein, conserved [Eimeria tenella]
MSVSKMQSGTPAHHCHATPMPTVAERPHGDKEAPPQVIHMTTVMPGDSSFVTWDQFQSAMSVIRTVIGVTVESGAMTPILPEDGSTMQAFLLRFDRRYTQMGLEPREWGNALIDHLVALDEYTGRFVAVAERGLDVSPDELADYYCTGLPTDLHLLITNNGRVKYQSWEQAATAAACLYEPKQSVLELRERNSRAIWAAIQANGPRRCQEIENRSGGTYANCFECQGRGHPAHVCPGKGERTKRLGEICKKCGGLRHYAREWTQPLSETRWESGSASILSEEAPEATTDSNRKPGEAIEDSYRSDATDIVPHWWWETCTKERYDQGGALCYMGTTAVLRVEPAGSPCEALLDTGASRSFISPKTVERLQLKVGRLPEEHRFTVAAVVRVTDRWTGEAQLQGDIPTVVHPTNPAEQAHEILVKQVAGISAEEAAIFLRPPPRRYKSHAKNKAKARITSLVRQAAADTKNLRAPLHGLHLILALHEAGSTVSLRFSD